jgi:uncharacterized protein
MKKLVRLTILIQFIGLIFTGAIIYSQSLDHDLTEALQLIHREAYPDPLFMWELTTDAAHVYFLGTIHLAPADLFPLDPRIEQALLHSDALVVEVNMLELDYSALIGGIMEICQYPPGTTIADDLSVEQLEQLQMALDSIGLLYGVIKQYKPWMLGLMISLYGDGSVKQLQGYGVDQYLMEQATDINLPIWQLETYREQLYYFDQAPKEEQILFLMHQIHIQNNADTYTTVSFDQFIDAWKQGDDIMMQALVESDDNSMLNLWGDILLETRNQRWAEKIDAWIKKGGTYFVAVGAAHLVGDESLIVILERLGYMIVKL